MKNKEKCKYFKEIDYGYRQSKQCYAQKCAPEVYCNGDIDKCSKYPTITEEIKQEEKQIEEMANIPTKEEIEARNKIGKEKDDLIKALLHYATAEASGGIKSLIDCEGCAFYLYEMLGYRKLPKDSVVFTEREFLDECELQYNTGKEKGGKETAEKILSKIKNIDTILKGYYLVSDVDLDELAKQFGIEIKE